MAERIEVKLIVTELQNNGRKLKDIDNNVNNLSKSFNNLNGFITKISGAFVAVFGVIKSGQVVFDTYKKVVESTQTTGDEYVKRIKGMESATNEFFRSIANGDWSNLIDRMKEAYEAGVKYAEQLDLIWDLTNAQSITLQKLRTEEAKQMNIVKDKANDLKTREEALNNVIQIKKDILKEQLELADLAAETEIDNIKKRTGLTKEEITYLISKKEAQEMLSETATKYSKIVETITNETEDQRDVNEKVKSYLKLMPKQFQENVRMMLAWNNVLDENKKASEADRKSLTRVLLTLEKLNTEYQRSQSEIFEQSEQIRNGLKAQQKSNDVKKETIKLTKEQFEAEKKLGDIDKINKKQTTVEGGVEKDDGAKGGYLIKTELDIIRENYYKELEAFRNKEQEKQEIREKSLAGLSKSFETFYNFNEAAMNRELQMAGDNEAKKDEIRRKYANKRKAAAITESIVNGALGITEIWSKTGSNPVLAGILTAIEAAAVASQIAIISSQQYAKGGILNGPSHANGGILTPYGELEGGEAVINKQSMSNPSLRSLASKINEIGGGVSFDNNTVDLINYEKLANAINSKRVYVVSSDITNRQGVDSKIIDRASL